MKKQSPRVKAIWKNQGSRKPPIPVFLFLERPLETTRAFTLLIMLIGAAN
jgi:hypothetical protein